MQKRILSVCLALAILFTSMGLTSTAVNASSMATYTMAPEIVSIVAEGYNEGQKGPIIITQGTMTKNGTTKDVYLITLSGTELVDNQSTGYLTDLLSGFNLDNRYYKNVVSVVTNNIPKNANLVLAGHSLGGMIAQQVASDTKIKRNYNVLNTVTFGSPLLAALTREGTVKRLGDKNDIVPYLSGSLFNNTAWAIAGLNREDGGYGSDRKEAHKSVNYARTDVWGNYDITGTKGGNASLTLDLSTKTFYKSPVTVD